MFTYVSVKIYWLLWLIKPYFRVIFNPLKSNPKSVPISVVGFSMPVVAWAKTCLPCYISAFLERQTRVNGKQTAALLSHAASYV